VSLIAVRGKFPAYRGAGELASVANVVAMARSSPYLIALSAEQERELARRAAAYSKPWRDVVRAKGDPAGRRGAV